ncbi:MAG TPA: cell division protein FtsZ [Nitrososphaera sp.]|jgi:cell division protein FtsZ|nr:cell division protein FtsZ [Nitrososphaera sp.]
MSIPKGSTNSNYDFEAARKASVTPSAIMEEETIRAVMEMAKPTVCVLGAGGAGSNIISWIKERGLSGGKLIAINTDAAHLGITKADRRILIGPKITQGRGCGGYAEKGMNAARESLSEIEREVQGANIIFLCAGLGGGTGTGAMQILAEELKRISGSLIIGVVTLPFAVERFRYDSAREALDNLQRSCDTLVTIDNNKLTRLAGSLPLQQALGVANELVGQFVKGITETITTASLINIDFADLSAIMEGRGLAAIGVGTAEGMDRIEAATRMALETQLLDIKDTSMATGVLVHVAGGEDITLEEVTRAGELVTRSLPQDVRIIWGARVEPSLRGKARVMIVLTGVETNFTGMLAKQSDAQKEVKVPERKPSKWWG